MIRDLLLPRTDAGVASQLVALVVVVVAALLVVRRSRDGVLFVVGLATLTLGFFGLRALH